MESDIPEKLVGSIRTYLLEGSKKAGLPNAITVAIGYDELKREGDSFKDCLVRADQNCYLDKKNK